MSDQGGGASGMGLPPFSPEPPLEAPPVVRWFKLYILIFVVIWVLFALVGVFFAIAGVASGGEEAIALSIIGVVYILVGLGIALVFSLPLFLRPRPWVWVYGIVLMALTMTNLLCIPAAIPLLIYWIKDDAKRYYGMM